MSKHNTDFINGSLQDLTHARSPLSCVETMYDSTQRPPHAPKDALDFLFQGDNTAHERAQMGRQHEHPKELPPLLSRRAPLPPELSRIVSGQLSPKTISHYNNSANRKDHEHLQ